MAHTPPNSQADVREDVRYRWTVLRAGSFKLDAGSMFGLIPRVVWAKSVLTDAQGRMEVHHNCILLERATDVLGGQVAPRHILLECGTGNKLDEKMSAVFALEPRWVCDALHEVGCDAKDVDSVIVTHLHFDHAGGLTRRPMEGESGGRLQAVPSFPNAAVHVQAREWSDALANRSVMTRTYYRDHLEPIADRVVLTDSPRPFVPGAVVDREADPPDPLEARMSEVAPGIQVFQVPGHTWGQQAVAFKDTSGRTVVFVPDVMPTAAHVGAAYSLAYDVEPYTSMVSKRWLLLEASRRRWTIVLDHEPGNPVRTVEPDGKGWFRLPESSA